MKKNGYFILSLDFELLWGIFDKVDYQKKETYFLNTRKVIPQLLDLFNEYKIACTWAVVGMLFNKNWQDWEGNFPENLPLYSNSKLSAYQYGKTIKGEDAVPFCFSPDLIQKIKEVPVQEIATHTYSHYYCKEKGQDLAAFKADLQKAIDLAQSNGIALESLVFPRNQFNEDYLALCYKMGIKNVRSNPSNWYWENTENDGVLTKIFRTGDAYLGQNNKSYKLDSLIKSPNQPLAQPASRLLRPYSNNEFLNNLKINRIKSEMTKAAINKEVYHLWWHPHNFGKNPNENLNDLKGILNHFRECRKKYHFQSFNMVNLGKLVKGENHPF